MVFYAYDCIIDYYFDYVVFEKAQGISKNHINHRLSEAGWAVYN